MTARTTRTAVTRSLMVAGALAATGLIAGPVSQMIDPSVTATDWPGFGGDGREQHYAPMTDINLSTVGKLGLAWHYDLPPGFTVGTPVAAEGKLFVVTGHARIRAFDAASGKLLWEFDGKVTEKFSDPLHLGWGTKGLAYWNGRVVTMTSDGRLFALDAKTGKTLWEKSDFDDPREVRYTLGAPRIFGGKVIVGHGGADITPIRGYVTAYDVMTGKRLWRFHTVPGDPSKPADSKGEAVMRPTWKGDWYGKGGGGTVWNAMSYDAKLNLIYLGVGNGYPYQQKLRSPGGGDNLFLASIVAVNATTGDYVWHYQTCPAEQWDCTATMDMTLADLVIDGKPRKVLMQAPKNGFMYVIDRVTGQFISAEKFAKVTWASHIDPATGRPVENPGIRYEKTGQMFELWPGPQGAHSWLPQAFSPQTGLLYIPVIDTAAMVGPAQPGMGVLSNLGAMMLTDLDMPGSRQAYLKAWDPVKQKPAWVVNLPGSWPGGVLATAGGLVFQGRIDGYLVAYDARTGKQVWSFKAQSPIVGAPISYRVGKRQYISVLTGNGSQGGGIMGGGNAAWRTDYALPRHVLTFVLGGKDKLPDFTPPPLVPPVDPDFKPDMAMVQKGGYAFAGNACLVCHGVNAVGAGAAPDLRFSPAIVDADAFRSIVKDGALRANAMPAYAQMTDEVLESIRHYLRFRATQAPAELEALKSGKRATPPAAATGGM